MITVSDKYKATIKKPVQTRRLRGQIIKGSRIAEFTEGDILEGSFKISNQICEASTVMIGGVYIGSLNCTFDNSLLFPRGDWQGATIIASDLLLVDEVNDVWESVPLGHYIVSEASWSAEGVTITAYDYMSKLDKACDTKTTFGTIYDLLVLACSKCKVELGMSKAETQELPNGNETLSLYSENDIETWRDFVSWVAQTCCCFATINRLGQLVLVALGTVPVDTIQASHRYQGGQFSDFESFYTGISYVNIKLQTTTYYSVKPDNGLTMNLGPNPFLQVGLTQTVKFQREAVRDRLAEFKSVPFNIQMIGGPFYELGDIIDFRSGIAGASSFGCVMFYEYCFNQYYNCQGYGENPALASAKSKTDKDIAGLSSRTDGNKISYTKFTNAEEYLLGLRGQKVTSIRFATSETTDVDIWHEYKILTDKMPESDRLVIKANYYLNGELIGYEPVETWAIDGYHILGLQYHLPDITNEQSNLWEVYLTLEGGTGSIAVGGANSVLVGQGMVGKDEWDGIIEISQEIEVVNIGSILPSSFRSEVNLVAIANDNYSVNDNIPKENISILSFEPINDFVYIDIKTEDAFARMSSMPEIYSGQSIGLI